MRKEYKEYQFDKMVQSIVHFGSLAKDGTDKECFGMFRYAPHFKEVFGTILGTGEPGVKLMKMVDKYLCDVLNASAQGKKVALCTFNFSPAVLKPLGVVPLVVEPLTTLGVMMWLRGMGEYLNYCCELGFTETSCSAQRGAMGAYLAGLGVKPDFVLCNSVGVCDTNATAFNFAAEYLDLPFYQLNALPLFADKRTIDYQHRDFRGLISFVEEQTGKKLDVGLMREVIHEIKKQDDLINEIQDLMQLKPSPVPGTYNVFMYSVKFIYGGYPEGTEVLESMLKHAKQNAAQGRAGTASGKEVARCFSVYVDHYSAQLRPWAWFDSKDISHVGSMMNGFWPDGAPVAKGELAEGIYKLDATNRDTMLDSLCDQMSRMPMVKQIRGPMDDPHQWLLETRGSIRTFKPDFCTYTGTIGCRNTWGAIKVLARDTEKMGLPTLILFGDAFDQRITSWESMRERIDEFLSIRGILK
ncbi:MAG: 2-hydroxyacyl-CoA dehydratase family protein [Syntrophaceae bacterium]